MKKPRVPRTRAGNTWTESQYWSFIRSGLRAKWCRYPPRFQVLGEAKRTVTGKRHKYEYQCSQCKKWKQQKEIEVDHIVPCGSLRSYEDLPRFAKNLFCEPEGLRVVCKECHKKITEESRKNGK